MQTWSVRCKPSNSILTLKVLWKFYCSRINIVNNISIGGSIFLPLGPIYLVFMQFFGKVSSNNRLVPLVWKSFDASMISIYSLENIENSFLLRDSFENTALHSYAK